MSHPVTREPVPRGDSLVIPAEDITAALHRIRSGQAVVWPEDAAPASVTTPPGAGAEQQESLP